MTLIHRCHAVRCRTPTPPKFLMCAECWVLVPEALKAAIRSTYMPGQERTKTPTLKYWCAAQRAIVHVARISHPDDGRMHRSLENMLERAEEKLDRAQAR